MTRVLLVLLLLPAAAPAAQQPDSLGTPPTEAAGLFVRALTEAYLDDHEQAVRHLERVLEMQPGEPAVLAALAESHEALGQPATALSYATQAAAAVPGEAGYLAQLARLQSEHGAPEDALASYERLVELTDDPEALADLGRLQERAGRSADALATYERLLTTAGEDAALRLRMEALYRRLGDDARALAMLEAAADAFPDERTLLYRLGLTYRDEGRLDDAVAEIDRIVAAHPDDAEAVLLLADALEATGDTERAASLRAGGAADSPEERLQRAALLYAQRDDDPNAGPEALRLLEPFADDPAAPAEALLLLGPLLFESNAYARAAEVLDRALAEDPRHPDAWTQAAAARLYSGDPAGALATADEALVLFPGQVRLLRIKAYALGKLDRPREAIGVADEAVAILAEEAPEDVKTRTRLLSLKALMHAEVGEHAVADATFEKALALAPESVLLLNNYAYTLAERGERLDEALAMAERAVAGEPNSAYFLDTLGWVLFKLGRLDAAADAIERAIAADDQFPLLYEHLGDVYEARGDRASARAAWERALDLDPENETLRQKLGES
ncbi:MAG: tetratricopeptide repeat protein [Rubricoccaceae bacterium]|nr:tetratricopeptide repeat protein [Rubricoccaceae bacterium]